MEKEGLLFTQVTLPHDWMISSPFDRNMKQGEAQGFFDRWGTGWYRRALHLEKKPETVYRLRFDGVYENSRVTVNGTYVGGRKYGYSTFTLDVTEALADGENEILVEVDNTTAPVDRWYTGAGIYRSVWLECLPERHLEREEVRVETGLKNGAEEKAARQAALLTVNPGCEGRVRALLRETRGNAGAEGCRGENRKNARRGRPASRSCAGRRRRAFSPCVCRMFRPGATGTRSCMNSPCSFWRKMRAGERRMALTRLTSRTR